MTAIRIASPRLSATELHVLQAIADGFTSVEIADNLRISVGTVNSRMYDIREKLDAETTAQAVAIAVRRRLID